MSNFNYGNSFNSYEGENVGVQRISVWKSVREFFPGGAVLTPDDYSEASSQLAYTLKAGVVITAGTPIYVEKPGGKAMFGTSINSKCIGLTYEDVEVGTDGCTFTIVTMGEFLESRRLGVNGSTGSYADIPEAVKTQLFGRISFITEV